MEGTVKKLVRSQAVVSFVMLAIFFFMWTMTDKVELARKVEVTLVATTLVTFFSTFITAFTAPALTATFVACAVCTALAAVFAHDALGFPIIFSLFAAFFAFTTAEELHMKRAQVAGVCLAQAAVLYGTMAGVMAGFGKLLVVMPAVSALALSGAFLVPTVTWTIERRRLLREKMELEQTISTLEEQRTQRVVPIGLGRTKRNLAAVNERLK